MKHGFTLDDMLDDAYKNLIFIMRLAYRLIYHIAHNNAKNRKLIASEGHLDHMLKQLGYQLRCAEALGEIFHDNTELVEGSREKVVDIIGQLIQKLAVRKINHRRQPRCALSSLLLSSH